MRYFITFGCYGAHSGAERRSMNQPPYEMDSESRAIVLQALDEGTRSACTAVGIC